MLLLKHTAATVQPAGRILKKDLHAAIMDAEGVLEAARREAALIRERAEADAELKRQEGFKQGQEEGKTIIAEQILNTMSQSAAYFTKVEGAMVELVMRALRHVVGEMNQRELIEHIVLRALESTRNESQVTVRVSPTQADALKARINDMVQAFPKIQFLDIQSDSNLPEHGCVLETEIGVVDASLETQLKAIEKALIRAMT